MKTKMIFNIFLSILAPILLFSQNQFFLNGITILEMNGAYYDVTTTDTLLISNEEIRIRFVQNTSLERIHQIENGLSLEKMFTTNLGNTFYKIPDTTNFFQFLQNLLLVPEINEIILSNLIKTQQLYPNDEYYELYPQWMWNLERLQMFDAWEISTGNSDVIVAVIDSGCDWWHEDLGPGNDGFQNIYINTGEDEWSYPDDPTTGDHLDNDGNGLVDDLKGWDWYEGDNDVRPPSHPYNFNHGTLVTGTIAAKTNNNTGVCGIAGGWNSHGISLMPVRAGYDNLETSAIYSGIEYAMKNGARILNFSFGGIDWYDSDIDNIINTAYLNYGVTMFAAVGNEKRTDNIAWPASHPYVIAVGGTDIDDLRWNTPLKGSNYSNTEPLTEISAPACTGFPYLSNTYEYGCGTSVATPMAVGVAALMLSINPCLTNVDIRDILIETADTVGGYNYHWNSEYPGHSCELGYGRINALLALQAVQNAIMPGANITGPILWDEVKWVNGDVTIHNGGILTITSTVKMMGYHKIIVKKGGQLIVDGGKITTTCNDFWPGIEVQGDPNLPQIPISNQGYVKVYNDGNIENADPGIFSENGGIIIAEDATFRNNKRSVLISNYQGRNMSSFTRCLFEYTESKGLTGGNQFCIGAENVKQFKVMGCIFKNDISISEMPYRHRGYGIVASNAEILISGAYAKNSGLDPNEVKSYFINFYFGVWLQRSGNSYQAKICESRFENNMKGLYLSGYNGTSSATVLKSIFTVLPPSQSGGNSTYGMYLNNCSGFTVEENEYYSTGTNPTGNGLIINESGQDNNEIYNNKFHDLEYATLAQGCNRNSSISGLCYKCNDFYDNHNDITITSDAGPGTPNQGIAIYQGSGTKPASNTFTVGNDSSFDINNSFDQIQYYHHQDGGVYNVIPFPTIGVLNIPVPGPPFNKTTDCPSHLGGGSNIDEIKSGMEEARIEADSLQDILFNLVDGGSTEDLANEVQTSIPPETLQVTNDLLNESPYLSDSVMKTAIAKEDVLPNAMIRDVLVENPQAAKSVTILEALDQRINPMPDSMMAQIMQGANILGEKEIKEASVSQWNQEYSYDMKTLIRLYTEDTSEVYGMDSLISLLNFDGSIGSKYNLVSLYYSLGMYSSGNIVLSSIPADFNLSEHQQQIHNMYVTLFPILLQVDSSSSGLASLDSAQIETLTNLAGNDKILPGAYARNLLIMNENLQYEEPVIYPSALKASKRYHLNDPSHGSYQEYWLKVYPNPAIGYFITEYQTIKSKKPGTVLSIQITDMIGHELIRLIPDRNYNQVVIPTETLNPGLYIITLKADGETVDQEKLILKK